MVRPPFQQMLTVGDMDGDGFVEFAGASNHIADGNTSIAIWSSSALWNGDAAPLPTYQYRNTRDGVADGSDAVWIEDGPGLAGTNGVPTLSGSGELAAGVLVVLEAAGTVPGAPSYLVVGLTALNAPFKGGVLVPDADLIIGPFSANASGDLLLAAPWPAGAPAGVTTWWQFWFQDVGGPVGFSASNGLRATTS